MPPKLPTPAMEFCGAQASCYAYAFYNWQTLIGGLIAIGAAWYAGGLVRRQIAASERVESDRLRRRDAAARAVLPLTLASFIDYSRKCVDCLRILDETELPKPADFGWLFDPPVLPASAISELERSIEAATDDLAAETLSRLAKHVQALHATVAEVIARYVREGSDGQGDDPKRCEREIQAARVHAMATTLLEYARHEGALPKRMTWDDIATSSDAVGAAKGTRDEILEARARGDDVEGPGSATPYSAPSTWTSASSSIRPD